MIVSTIDAARTVPEVVMLVWMSHSLQENCSQRGKQWGREEMGEFDIHVTRLRAARAGYTLSDTLHHWQGSKTRIGDRESGSPIKTLRNWRMPDPGGKLEEIRGHYRARVFKSSCDGWMMILTPRKPSVPIPRKSLRIIQRTYQPIQIRWIPPPLSELRQPSFTQDRGK